MSLGDFDRLFICACGETEQRYPKPYSMQDAIDAMWRGEYKQFIASFRVDMN